MQGNEMGFIRKNVADLIGMPARRIQFYTDERLVIPDVENPKGRGTTRRYSEFNMIEFLIIKELANGGISLEKIKGIMFTVRDLLRREAPHNHLWDSETKTGGFLVIYDPIEPDGSMMGSRPGNSDTVTVRMDKAKTCLIIDIDKLAKVFRSQ